MSFLNKGEVTEDGVYSEPGEPINPLCFVQFHGSVVKQCACAE